MVLGYLLGIPGLGARGAGAAETPDIPVNAVKNTDGQYVKNTDDEYVVVAE